VCAFETPTQDAMLRYLESSASSSPRLGNRVREEGNLF
jgi:hypothetical protein